MKKENGLAQIPLMIVLLLMAIAVPLATQLVQNNQDNRSSAMQIVDDKSGGVATKKAQDVVANYEKVNPPKEDKYGVQIPISTFNDPYEGVGATLPKVTEMPMAPFVQVVAPTGSSSYTTSKTSSITTDPAKPHYFMTDDECNVAHPDLKFCSASEGGCNCGETSDVYKEFKYIPSTRVGDQTPENTKPVNYLDDQTCKDVAGDNSCEAHYGRCNCGYELLPNKTRTPIYYFSAPPTWSSKLNITSAPVAGSIIVPSSSYRESSDYLACLVVLDPVECDLKFAQRIATFVPPAVASKTSSTTKKKSSASTNSLGCDEQCPGTDGVLRNCTNTIAVGEQSNCDSTGRVQACGGRNFCCPSAGGAWTDNMTSCPSAVSSVNDAVLNYKIAFGGVIPTSSQCVISWPLKISVLGSGESKAYTGVLPESVATVNNKLIFSGSLTLTGFTKTSGIAAFISGPKSLQIKYGINNQTEAYNKAGGELVLTTSRTTSPINDFSGYPLLPGDVIDTNLDTQDGWINGIDFAYVKSRSLVHETVSPGGYLKGDLDGNCQVNSNDVNLLKISLQEKQGQLY